MRYSVPLVVLSTFNPGPGTWIVKEEELMEKPIVTGITHRVDEAKLTLHKLPQGIRSLNTVFGALAREGLFVDMISQTGNYENVTNVSFTLPADESTRAVELIRDMLHELRAEDIEIDPDIAKVSVVGVGMRYHTGVAAQMFSALAAENIDVKMISTSEIKISVVIPRKYCEVAVRSLHESFIAMNPEVSQER
jgi:aspartate kinase